MEEGAEEHLLRTLAQLQREPLSKVFDDGESVEGMKSLDVFRRDVMSGHYASVLDFVKDVSRCYTVIRQKAGQGSMGHASALYIVMQLKKLLQGCELWSDECEAVIEADVDPNVLLILLRVIGGVDTAISNVLTTGWGVAQNLGESTLYHFARCVRMNVASGQNDVTNRPDTVNLYGGEMFLTQLLAVAGNVMRDQNVRNAMTAAGAGGPAYALQFLAGGLQSAQRAKAQGGGAAIQQQVPGPERVFDWVID
jgi:hypothetical protein